MSTNETAHMTPVVLAHGAWADGSSWSRVIRSLREHGVKATAAPLPLTSLADDVTALDRTLERVGTPALLVGHAYAGAVIGSVAPEKVSGLVHVAALAPDEGETVADVFYREPPHPEAPDLEPDGDGLVWLPEAAFGKASAQDAPPEEHAVLAAVQRPIAIGSITTAVGAPAWRTRPSWYFLAERDRMIPRAAQRFMADRMRASARSLDTDHAPLLTAAELVSDLILEAVHEIEAGR
ncbi:alpha/beta fold hydrolase [Streptomyces montanisoli]|uniref:Alpha/beta hydrolase n=1 Tax=Streptomyces montanisoli TaxID=2798581 RepID=A0A940RTQ0_9ACTN|nr:alpha/beta hydrolase [Streptomyces montanisoli]MBP0456411.1 alpha/beta hydrolase [Streptomyces montanisoli]